MTTTAEALEAVGAGRGSSCATTCPRPAAHEVEAVRATGEPVELEATGGLTLEVARGYAVTGVDYLSRRGADPLLARSSTSRSTSTPRAPDPSWLPSP